MTNNKQQTNAYLTFFLSLIFIYLIISFGVWDLNASHWDKELRMGYAFFAPIMAMLCVGYTKINKL
jgi:hypothetical protein